MHLDPVACSSTLHIMDLPPNLRALALITLCLPLFVACGSMSAGDDDSDSGPSKLSDRISNLDRTKQFDKKTLDLNKEYSSGGTAQNYERSQFQGKRTSKLDSANVRGSYATNRYNTERFQAAGATEQKKTRFLFFGDRDKKQKTSTLMDRRSRDDGSARYTTRNFTDTTNINALIGDRSERDVSSRYFSTEFPGTGGIGAASPTIIRESTQSEGDIRALLNDG